MGFLRFSQGFVHASSLGKIAEQHEALAQALGRCQRIGLGHDSETEGRRYPLVIFPFIAMENHHRNSGSFPDSLW